MWRLGSSRGGLGRLLKRLRRLNGLQYAFCHAQTGSPKSQEDSGRSQGRLPKIFEVSEKGLWKCLAVRNYFKHLSKHAHNKNHLYIY